MFFRFLPIFALLAAGAQAALTPAPPTAPKADTDPAQIAFFEKNIRPVLAQKCYKCHSAEADKAKGGLLLDTRESTRQGGDSGHAVVPGNPKESLLMKALTWTDKDLRMPPEKEGGKLPENVIADFEKWIAAGAADPRAGAATPVTKKEIDWEKARQFWAFQAPKQSEPPAVKDAAWPRTEVDRYILAAQEAKGLHPVADAEKPALLRRTYFDLIGLPPSPEEADAFFRDSSPDAFAKVVDRLLASPQFGERWGRHWLDVARFAESTGKERNFTYPTAWRYRDWVIDAMNADKPYDAFIREQIAGDLMPAKSEDERKAQVVATGFLAIGARSLQEKNPEQFKADQTDEQIDTTTRAVLGLTVACARCHDHKFDPVPQKDYYALAGIFRSTETCYGTNYVRAGMNARNTSTLINLAALPEQPVAAPEPPKLSLNSQQAQRLAMLEKKDPEKAAKVKANLEQRVAAVEPLTAGKGKGKKKNQAGAPAAPAASAAPAAPAPKAPTVAPKKRGPRGQENYGELAMGVHDSVAVDSRLLVRGEVSQAGDPVPRGFVSVVATPDAPAIPAHGSGRLELAAWLTSPQNPLTARVAVNRIWLHLFGAGLVRTADNFGATGERPSHPELLDALAVQFMRDGWSVKKLVRSLVLSRTYQLANVPDAKGDELDPDNRLLWQASQRRLDAEAIRDAILAASGQLELKRIEGSVVSKVGDVYIGKQMPPERFSEVKANYRSVYLPIVRDYTPEVLELFDFAEPSLVVAAREATNVPSQALYLMNNSFVREQATAMARRLLAMPGSEQQRIASAYRLTLGRAPTPAEFQRADQYIRDTHAALPSPTAEVPWSSFCQALFACAEFRYLR